MEETFEGKQVGSRRDAQELAIQVLNFIVGDLDRIIQFLNVTGLQPETIRESAKSPLFLLGVLDYILKDEDLLKEFHRQTDIRPAAILVAAAQLTPEPEGNRPEPATARAAPAQTLPRRSLFH
jgi:hypothetical protein